MQNDMMKRLLWQGLLAALGALATMLTTRVATTVWRRMFDEEPPE
ncbi:MAG TPA: hypothetical protein VKV16_03935 [Solirubrobacteraceae bacterium]|nr:hypothetical protein [Solirubrobacteraceae bacterium]